MLMLKQIVKDLQRATKMRAKEGNMKVYQDPAREKEIIIDIDGYFTPDELQTITDTARENNLVIQPGIIRDEKGQEIENEYRLYLFRLE